MTIKSEIYKILGISDSKIILKKLNINNIIIARVLKR